MSISVRVPEKVRAARAFTATLRTDFTTETVFVRMRCGEEAVRFSVDRGPQTEAYEVTVTFAAPLNVTAWAPSGGKKLQVFVTRGPDDAERLAEATAGVLP